MPNSMHDLHGPAERSNNEWFQDGAAGLCILKHLTRRCFIRRVLQAGASICLYPLAAAAADPCRLPHPLDPPDPIFSGQCPNCGMLRARWARTWKTFDNTFGVLEGCSFHCLADMAQKSGEVPRRVKTALYRKPHRMVAAEDAAFVIGSRSPGTMTLTSKLAFASQSAASDFVRTCGGRIATFPVALAEAQKTLQREKPVIARKRLQTGKIVNPVDHKEECPVCSMYPARYPRNRCQIRTANQTIYHFCSTRCLFAFLDAPQKFAPRNPRPLLIWVSDYLHGGWISARTAYYVVGSKQWGPMGREAFAFDRKIEAQEFQQRRGGRLRTYLQMDPAAIEATHASDKE